MSPCAQDAPDPATAAYYAGAVVVAQFCGAGRRVRIRGIATCAAFHPPRRSPCASNTCHVHRMQSGRQPCGSSARAFFTGVAIGRGPAQVRVSGGLVRAVCSACRSSQWVELPGPPRLHIAACVCVRSAYRRMCARAIAGLGGERRRALEMVQSATWREARRLHIMRCSLQRKQREGILQNVRDLADVEERCGQSGVPYRAPLLGPQKSSAR